MARLLLVATLLLGLVATTPVLCVCDPSDHGGMALHSLLPHTHDRADAAQHAHGGAADHHGGAAHGGDHAAGTHSPGMTAQTGAGAASLTAVGAVGPVGTSPWRIETIVLGRLTPPLLLAPLSDLRPPLGPPPRQPAR